MFKILTLLSLAHEGRLRIPIAEIRDRNEYPVGGAVRDIGRFAVGFRFLSVATRDN
jgi:hypothetical protein